MQAGDQVIYTDPDGQRHRATIDYAWSENCVNLSYPVGRETQVVAKSYLGGEPSGPYFETLDTFMADRGYPYTSPEEQEEALREWEALPGSAEQAGDRDDQHSPLSPGPLAL